MCQTFQLAEILRWRTYLPAKLVGRSVGRSVTDLVTFHIVGPTSQSGNNACSNRSLEVKSKHYVTSPCNWSVLVTYYDSRLLAKILQIGLFIIFE
jgi:hypothetical protein